METSGRLDVGRGRASHGFLGASWSQLATFWGASWEWLVDARGPHEQQLGTNAGPVQACLGALGGAIWGQLQSLLNRLRAALGPSWWAWAPLWGIQGEHQKMHRPVLRKGTKEHPPYIYIYMSVCVCVCMCPHHKKMQTSILGAPWTSKSVKDAPRIYIYIHTYMYICIHIYIIIYICIFLENL